MATEGLVQLWNKWGIQIMVLASFALQVFLLSTGGIRRRSSNAVLRFSLWLAYLLADSMAIYTLGHLSVISSRSKEHQLVAFWAPFLLVHLGGPDNITAYALEDNRLWLRHLQTLTVQVVGAAYVVYKYMATGGSLLLCASISMFVVGVLKYGERTWALKHGNISSIRSSIHGRERNCARLSELLKEGSDDEEQILLQAHFQFFLCKSIFTEAGLSWTTLERFPSELVLDRSLETLGTTTHQKKRDRIKKWVELELSLMYDILYTKAVVIHTWYGLCIHLVSLLGTAAAFLLFQLSISGHTYPYSRVDVIVSYVLLVGALLLEAMSLCRAVLSSWTTSRLLCRKRGKYVGALITSLRRRVKAARRRRWAGSIGQYNLFHFATRDRKELWTRLATKMGLLEWWSQMHFSGTFSPTDSFSMKDLEDLVLPLLWQYSSNKNAFTTRGKSSVENSGMHTGVVQWSVSDIDLRSSILVWHIATDVYIQESMDAQQQDQKLAQATQVLSNYMMFLLVAKPDMLPGHTRHDLYTRILQFLEDRWRRVADAEGPSQEDQKSYCKLKDLFHQQGPCGSTNPRWEKLAKKLFQDHRRPYEPQYRRIYLDVREADVEDAILLAKVLIDERMAPMYFETVSALEEMIFKVWVELMLYAAEHCNRDSHARELSNGGEFITMVWLLLHHLKDYNDLRDRYSI